MKDGAGMTNISSYTTPPHWDLQMTFHFDSDGTDTIELSEFLLATGLSRIMLFLDSDSIVIYYI